MPLYVGNATEPVKTQIFISEVALNNALRTLFDNGTLKKGFRFPSTYVKTSIPNIEEVYGKHEAVFLEIEALAAPTVYIRTENSKAYFDASFRLLNPHNEDYDAFKGRIVIVADVEFELLEDFTLVGHVKDLKTEIKEFKTYFKSKVTAATINRQLEVLKPTAL